eukprot:9406705-Alexandrium_andersonii.AAC.1
MQRASLDRPDGGRRLRPEHVQGRPSLDRITAADRGQEVGDRGDDAAEQRQDQADRKRAARRRPRARRARSERRRQI